MILYTLSYNKGKNTTQDILLTTLIIYIIIYALTPVKYNYIVLAVVVLLDMYLYQGMSSSKGSKSTKGTKGTKVRRSKKSRSTKKHRIPPAAPGIKARGNVRFSSNIQSKIYNPLQPPSMVGQQSMQMQPMQQQQGGHSGYDGGYNQTRQSNVPRGGGEDFTPMIDNRRMAEMISDSDVSSVDSIDIESDSLSNTSSEY